MTGPRVIQVIEASVTRGDGALLTPYRRVQQYWSLGGDLLAEVDSVRSAHEVLETVRALLHEQVKQIKERGHGFDLADVNGVIDKMLDATKVE